MDRVGAKLDRKNRDNTTAYGNDLARLSRRNKPF
jgi:hypothetical protein